MPPDRAPLSELLPCPFCGGEARLVSAFGTTVQCQNDQCIIGSPEPFNDFTHRSDAIAAWNRRASLPRASVDSVVVPREPTQEMLDALEAPLQAKDGESWQDYTRRIYARLLAASPAPTRATMGRAEGMLTDGSLEYWKRRRKEVIDASDDGDAWDAASESFDTEWDAAFSRALTAIAREAGCKWPEHELNDMIADVRTDARTGSYEKTPMQAAKEEWESWCDLGADFMGEADHD